MKNSLFLRINLFVIFVAFGVTSIAQTYDWNVATGGNSARNGATEHYGSLEEPEVLWSGGEYAAYAGYPVIEGDKLVVYRRTAANPSSESWIVCYNVYSGEELWRAQLPIDPNSDKYSKVSAVHNGRVFATRSGGSTQPSKLYALDLENGEILWGSENDVTESVSETVSFAENGDIIAGNYTKILCINPEDGTTKWILNRQALSSDGASVSCFNNKGYYWELISSNAVVSVCDLTTGEALYSSDALGTYGAQQQGLLVGNDGTVYAPKCSGGTNTDFIFSLTDTGSELNINWSYPMGYSFAGCHGVSPDGTVYTLSKDFELVRLDPADGSVINSTGVLAGNGVACQHFAFGADGMLYYSLQDYPYYRFFIFNPELEEIWSEQINGLRGIALGDGVFVVNGKQNIIIAYDGRFKPVADAGPNQIVESGSFVTLDGSNSYDLDEGDVLEFQWTAPDGIILDNENSEMPTFTAPIVTEDTDYQFYLSVSDDAITSTTDTVVITVTYTINVDKISNSNFSIYPNPSQGVFSIKKLSNSEDILDMEITDFRGTKIEFFKHIPSQIDFSDKPKGIYFLKIRTKNGISTKKLIIRGN